MINNLITKEDFYLIFRLFYLFASFIALILATQLDTKKINLNKISTFFCIVLAVIICCIVGFRDYEVGTDTINYYNYNWIRNFPPDSKAELLFYLIIDLVKRLKGSYTIFLITISIIFYLFFTCSFKVIAKVFNANLYLIFFAFISFFFATSLATNIIRQGLALSILTFAYSLYLSYDSVTKKYFLSKILPLLVISFLIHTTSIIPILTILILIVVKNKLDIKYLFLLYTAGIVLSAANLGILTVAPFLKEFMGDDRRMTYLRDSSSTYNVGFKPQFVMFNTLFLVLSIFIKDKISDYKLKSKYNLSLKYYILMSFLFFMAFQIPYSDRWGLFSWIIIPILLTPYFSRSTKMKLNTVIVLLLITINIFFTLYASIK